MPRALLLVLAICLIAVRGICRAEDSGLSVSIVIPHVDTNRGELLWPTGPSHPHFQVLLPDNYSKERGVWTGKITSPPVECFIK